MCKWAYGWVLVLTLLENYYRWLKLQTTFYVSPSSLNVLVSIFLSQCVFVLLQKNHKFDWNQGDQKIENKRPIPWKAAKTVAKPNNAALFVLATLLVTFETVYFGENVIDF